MTTTWAAKVLEGVERLHVLQKTWIGYADALAAIARMGAGDGLVERAEAFMATVKDYNYRTSDIEASPALITDLLARIAALTAQNREMALDVLASSGQAADAYAAQLAAEAEAAALRAKVARLEGALRGLHHAVCGETGFAACVRLDSGKAYPWPALDAADDAARAALTDGGKDG